MQCLSPGRGTSIIHISISDLSRLQAVICEYKYVTVNCTYFIRCPTWRVGQVVVSYLHQNLDWSDLVWLCKRHQRGYFTSPLSKGKFVILCQFVKRNWTNPQSLVQSVCNKFFGAVKWNWCDFSLWCFLIVAGVFRSISGLQSGFAVFYLPPTNTHSSCFGG